MKFLMRT